MKAKTLVVLWLVCVVLMNGATACCCGFVPRPGVSEATAVATAEATEAATEIAPGVPTDTPAPGPGQLTTPPPVHTMPPPPMPSPETCAAESEPFWHWQIGRIEARGFFFTSASAGFAVGGPYTLLHTEDGGSTWTVWPINSPYSLNAIYFSDPRVGWVAGDNGTILKTEDGGLTWQLQRTGTQANFYVIEFLDDQIGWAGGPNGTLLHTTDSGATWSAGATGQQIDIVDVTFVNGREGYLVGHSGPTGYVLQSSDGGATWQDAGHWGSVPETIYAAEGRTTWLAGGWVAGKVWRSIGHDSRTLVVENLFPPSCGGTGYHFRQILFSDAQHGWAVGDCGLAISTQDGGENWQPMGVDGSAYWKMLRFTSGDEAVLAGYSEQDGIQVAHSSDGGITWSPASPGDSLTSRLEVHDLDFVDSWFGWTLATDRWEGPTNLFATRDSGQTWEKYGVPGGEVSQLEFVDRLRGWAIGGGGLIARSDDGGQSWVIQPVLFPGVFNAMSFVDREHGWVISAATGPGACQEHTYEEPSRLTLFRTSSGGDVWDGPVCIEVPEEVTESYSSYSLNRLTLRLQFVDQETGWIVGVMGLIMKTTDGGLTWQRQTSGVAVDLADVYFVDAQAGWVTGDQGVLLETANGGAHWTQQRLGDGRLTGVRFVDRETGWVTSSDYPDNVFHTADGGQTWNAIAIPYGNILALDAVDERHVWVGTKGDLTAYAPVCLP